MSDEKLRDCQVARIGDSENIGRLLSIIAAHLESLGALSREEAAIGASLVLADLVRELNRREVERLSLRSDLREKGLQP